MFDLNGKRALVTGSSRGIGRAIAILLAKCGAEVIVHGAGNIAKTHRAVHTALPLSIIIGFILTAVGLIFCKPMLALIATPPELIDHSVTYMRFYFCAYLLQV